MAYISKGAYGVVYHNQSRPGHVIKQYFTRKNNKGPSKVNSEIKKLRQIYEITKNKGHLMEKIEGITYNRIPNNVKHKPNISRFFEANRNSYNALRMPNLGIDLLYFKHYLKHDRKKLEGTVDSADFIPRLLLQYHKLIHQIYLFSINGVCHGDIHEKNIMINPTTCDMTLIDFDLFGSYHDYIEKYLMGEYKNATFSHMPPEYLIIRKQITDFDMSVYSNAGNITDILNDVYKIPYPQRVPYIREANSKNTEYLLRMNPESNFSFDFIATNLLQFYDNFGLGNELLLLLYSLYPAIINEAIKNSDDRNTQMLKKTIQLLKRMSSFVMAERPTPKQAIEEMEQIINKVSGGRKSKRNKRRYSTRSYRKHKI